MNLEREIVNREQRVEYPEATAEIERKFFEEVDHIMRERHAKGNPYHNTKHPENVNEASAGIEEDGEESGIAISSQQKLARKVAAKTHDIVVRYSIAPQGAFNAGERVRLRGFGEVNPNKGGFYKVIEGNKVETISAKQIEEAEKKGTSINVEGWSPIIGNEEDSWQEAHALMNKYDPEGKIFTPYVQGLVRKEIGATYPDFGFAKFKNQERAKALIDESFFVKDAAGEPVYSGLLVDQTFLRKNLAEASIEEIAVGAGDILYGGEKPFDEFFTEAMNEARESIQWIEDSLDQKGFSAFSPDEKVRATKAMFGWVSTQPGFLLHQWERFEEITQVNENIKNNMAFKGKLETRYSHFEDNIKKMNQKVLDLKQAYADLAQESVYPASDGRLSEFLSIMGYKITAQVDELSGAA